VLAPTLPCPCWLRHVREIGRFQVVSNEASIGLLVLRLTASLAKAPHAPSRTRTLGSLHVSSVVHMVNSFHLTGRRQLAWRTGRLHCRCARHRQGLCPQTSCSSTVKGKVISARALSYPLESLRRLLLDPPGAPERRSTTAYTLDAIINVLRHKLPTIIATTVSASPSPGLFP